MEQTNTVQNSMVQNNMTQDEKLDWVRKYSALPTGNISDAMDSLGLKRGIVLGLRPVEPTQPRAAGFALTIQQMRRRTAWDNKNLARHSRIIDTETAPGDMLVIDMGGITDVSTGGDMLALRAKLRGVSGELTNGCLRDADEIAAMGFPAYCAGTAPTKSAYDIETIGVNVPVMIGSVQICPGDLILMDRTGVVSVPFGHIAAVYEKAASIAAFEDRVVEFLKEGKSLTEARKAAAVN